MIENYMIREESEKSKRVRRKHTEEEYDRLRSELQDTLEKMVDLVSDGDVDSDEYDSLRDKEAQLYDEICECKAIIREYC